MSVRTRLAAGLAMAPLLAAGLFLAATPAWAASSLTLPDKPVTAHVPVLLEGKVDDATEAPNRIQLRVTPPPPKDQQVTVDEAQPGTTTERTVRFWLKTEGCNLPGGACTDDKKVSKGLDLANGSYRVALVAVAPAGSSSELKKGWVTIDVPARVPTDVTAVATGDREITVSWARGPEPDLLNWEVVETGGATQTVTPGGPPAAGQPPGPCVEPSSRCQKVFSYGSQEPATHSFIVRAARACASPPDCTPAQVPSAEVSATLASGATGPPGGAPIVAGPGFSTPPAGTSGTTFAQGFGSKLGLPKLPPLPTAPAPAIAPPADTFDPTLAYPEPGEQLAQPPEPVVAGRDARLTSTGDGLLQSEPVVRGVAGALVLVLTAAHLRRWLSVGIPDEQMD